MADVFVSYARSDKARVAPLVAAIEAQGWTVWWDPEISPGQEFDQQIAAELKIAAAVVVVWTPSSVRSRWVRGEARDGAERGILVPVRFGDPDLPIDVRTLHTTDFNDWDGNARSPHVIEVVRALKAMIDRQRVDLAEVPLREQPVPARDPSQIAICVLPFANMSGDPEQEYFSDGITEDVITDLSKVAALKIISRNSAFVYKGKNVDLPRIARDLDVSHVLEGSVRKSKGRVRITAQLVDASSNGHLWAERYDRDLDDIFELQDQIAHAIVAALKLKLLPEERRSIEQRGTEDAEAYNLYLMARQQYVTSTEGDAAHAEAIIRLCTRATEIDPNYARAWALLALGMVMLRYVRGGNLDSGLSAAERALALDAKLAEAHAIKARIFSEAGQYDAASVEIDNALRLDPESYEVNRSAAYLRYRQHRLDDAIHYFEKAMTLFEMDVNSANMLVACYTAVGDPQGVERVAKFMLAQCEKTLARDANNVAAMAYCAGALGALGQAKPAKAWMNRSLILDPDNVKMRYNFGCTLASWLTDTDAALEMLGPLFSKISAGMLNHAKADADLDSLRDDPRFEAMIASAEARLAAEQQGSS